MSLLNRLFGPPDYSKPKTSAIAPVPEPVAPAPEPVVIHTPAPAPIDTTPFQQEITQLRAQLGTVQEDLRLARVRITELQQERDHHQRNHQQALDALAGMEQAVERNRTMVTYEVNKVVLGLRGKVL